LRSDSDGSSDHTIRALFAQERFFEILRASLERIAKP